MKNLCSVLMQAALVMAPAACHAAGGSAAPAVPKSQGGAGTPSVAQYVKNQGWSLLKSAAAPLPVRDIAPVLYRAEGDFAPSCGLLAQTPAGTDFFQIQSPEQETGTDAAVFDLRNRRYLVFEYINRDTKEDFYRQYFYLYRDPAGRYVADGELNNSAAWSEPFRASPHSNNASRVQEGVRRAKGISLSKALPGMRFLERDFIVGKSSTFAVFHNTSDKKCAFLVDAGVKPVVFEHELFARGDTCNTVLAAGKMEHAGATYYLSLFKGASRNHLGILSVSPDRTVAAENKMAIAAGKRSALADLKTAKEAVKSTL